jgi:hypothetical protein
MLVIRRLIRGAAQFAFAAVWSQAAAVAAPIYLLRDHRRPRTSADDSPQGSQSRRATAVSTHLSIGR